MATISFFSSSLANLTNQCPLGCQCVLGARYESCDFEVMSYNSKVCILLFLTEHAEADSFFCFTHVMSEIRDNFIKSLDDSACGIGE